METEALIKLAGTAKVADVEEQWIALMEDESTTPETLAGLLPVLETLGQRERPEEAATLGWSALETLKDRFEPGQLLLPAGQILMLFSENQELRDLVTGLFRAAYQDRSRLDHLLDQAGIAGGRPPRRALRTLEVCLTVEDGTYLASRHTDAAAQLTSVDSEAWRFRVLSGGEETEYGPVELADQFAPVDEDDYRVLRDFRPERLAELIEKNPEGVVVAILRAEGREIDSDWLEARLCPTLIEPSQWKKWWSRARAALKKSPHVKIEGRSPHYLTYLAEAESLEDEVAAHFAKLADPEDQLASVDGYLRECRSRKQNPDVGLLRDMCKRVDGRARRQESRRAGWSHALAFRLVQRRIEQESGGETGEAAAVKLLVSADDPCALILGLELEQLWLPACACLEQAYPDRRAGLLTRLLPVSPMRACDTLATKLVEAGCDAAHFEELVETILSDPIGHNGALLWLWDGPSQDLVQPCRLVMLLSRILNVLADVKRDETVSRKVAKRIAQETRSIFAARRFERFKACLEEMDHGLSVTFRRQISRLDNLGRAVHEDLQKLIRHRFPVTEAAPEIEPWADEEVLWTSPEGLSRHRADINEMVNVKMKENAKRIGEAASHGDLSENSEYKFALEERDLLRSRLALMQEQVAMAKVIPTGDVPADRIGVGSCVTFRNVETGEAREITFLGPFDACVDRLIYNYKSPFAQSVMGKQIGEQVELTVIEPQGLYEIAALSNALAAPKSG